MTAVGMNVEGFASSLGLPALCAELAEGGEPLERALASGDTQLVGHIVLAVRRNTAVRAAAPFLNVDPLELPRTTDVVASIVAGRLPPT